MNERPVMPVRGLLWGFLISIPMWFLLIWLALKAM